MAEVTIPVDDNVAVSHPLAARSLTWYDAAGELQIQFTSTKIIKITDQANPPDPTGDGLILNENFDAGDIPTSVPPGTGLGGGDEEFVHIVGIQVGINGPVTPPKIDVVMADSANWQSIFAPGDDPTGLFFDEYVTLQTFRVRPLAGVDDPLIAGTNAWHTNGVAHSCYIPCDIRARWLDDWPPTPVMITRESAADINYVFYGIFIEV